MLLVMEKFPKEYSLETKSLGKKYKLFVQLQWNSRSWTELPDTDTMKKY